METEVVPVEGERAIQIPGQPLGLGGVEQQRRILFQLVRALIRIRRRFVFADGVLRLALLVQFLRPDGGVIGDGDRVFEPAIRLWFDLLS